MNPDISYFAVTNSRRPPQPIGLYQADRLQHVYVLGKTGTGKSTLIEALAMQDIAAGRGMILIDPHGDLAERLAARVPEDQQHRLIYIDVANAPGGYGYNPLRNVAAAYIPRVVSGLLETFRHHFGEKSWGSRMEHILRNVLYALLEYGGASLPDILKMLSEKEFRARVTAKVTNRQVRYFFDVEFSKLWGRTLFDAIAPIQNKVGAFLTDPVMMQTLVTHREDVSFRRAMDQGQIVIVNLARGLIGSDTAHFLGSMFTQTIALAALSRLDTPETKRRPAFLYLDEFEHLLTGGTATMLSEVRKAALGVILANQYLHQLDEDVQAAVLGNVGTMIAFRTGPEDAKLLTRLFGSGIELADLQSLPNHSLYVQMMIEGEPSRVFSGNSLVRLRRPIALPDTELATRAEAA